MLSIDEAIEFCNEKSKNIKLRTEPKTFEQLAEWLEELKVYQQHEIICNKGYNAGYNKAIDDFAEKMKYEYESDEIHETIDEISKQLKAGGKNEQSI